MFDSIDPRIFWPLFVLFWTLAGFVVAYVVGGIIRWCDNPTNRYEGDDVVADRRRRLERSGFKTKAGMK